eukprot:EG_transcript_7241
MLLHNGAIYVGWGPAGPHFCDWMRLQPDGTIGEMGQAPAPAISDPAAATDLGGRLVLPGLHDSHLHVYELGRLASTVDLEDCTSIEAMQQRIADFVAKTHPLPPVVICTHWDQERLGATPTRRDLDAVLPHTPCVAHRRCWHVLVANSRALAECGVTRDTPCPAGGMMDRDAAGELTGVLRENSTQLVEKLLRPPTDPVALQAVLRRGLHECLRQGITAVQTNDSTAVSGFGRPFEAYAALEEQDPDGLPIRVALTMGDTDVLDHPPLRPPVPWRPGRLLSCDRLKVFADGALGASTAALEEPYSDDPMGSNRGMLLLSPKELRDRVAAVHGAGYRLEVHAIGDRAARVTVEAIEAAGMGPEDRPVLTHCQLLSPDTVAAMARLGVIANIQPQFAHSDSRIAVQRLGRRRLEQEGGGGYPCATLLARRVPVCGGSDAPIETPCPLLGMYYAITREGDDAPPLRPSEAVSFPEALALYTTGAAFAARQEARLGRLQPGWLADFVVLSDNVALDVQRLKTCRVEQVWVAGRRRYTAEDDSDPPGRRGREGFGKWGPNPYFRCPCCVAR